MEENSVNESVKVDYNSNITFEIFFKKFKATERRKKMSKPHHEAG